MSFKHVIPVILPELLLIVTACALLLLGVSSRIAARKLAPALALGALLIAFIVQVMPNDFRAGFGLPRIESAVTVADPTGAVQVGGLGQFIKLIASGVGMLFVLLSWPSDRQASGNAALHFGTDAAGEFFGLMLLSIAGIFVVAGANDIILLFLGIELASIPTYIMVSISRPLPAAQEAGVKYFFLGAMSAAVMLFGFSYLYGTTGLIEIDAIARHFAASARSSDGATALSSWQMLAVVMLIGGFAFKMAAVPFHFYAGDVYEGAATPVTALLSFVPKITGFVALIKVLFAVSGGAWLMPGEISRLLWVLAVLSMTVGNVLGLMQQNVKRVLAYSSIAHTGYMLVGVSALVLGGRKPEALQGVLFYLASYGIMNVAAFGVLVLLPSRSGRPATSAETFQDLAGVGQRHVGLALAMAVACFSLTGLPLTIGFFGKVYLIRPAWAAESYWLVVIMMINAAIGAGYYLRIVATMFLGTDQPQNVQTQTSLPAASNSTPVLLAVALSTAGTLLFGVVLPATDLLHTEAVNAAHIDLNIVPLSASSEP